MHKKAIFIIMVLTAQGCSHITTLDVRHDSHKFRGPVSELDGLDISTPIIIDSRINKDSIKFEEIGGHTITTVTLQPIEKIVTDALLAGFFQNGISVVESGRIKIEGEIVKFKIDAFAHGDVVSEIQCKLNFIDTTTQQSVYKSDYSGAHSEKSKAILRSQANKEEERMMSTAVNSLVEDVMYDEELVEALEDL